jgi:hypothetical protein
MTNIHPIKRLPKLCKHCSKTFRPRDPRHAYCWDCWKFGMGSAYIANAVALFKSTEPR